MEAEARDTRFQHGRPFAGAISDPVVLHQDDPSALPGFSEPYLVVGVLRKHIVVSDHDRMNGPESGRHLDPAQAPIAEQLRQLPLRGSPPRS